MVEGSNVCTIAACSVNRNKWQQMSEIAKRDGRSRTYIINALIDSFVAGELVIYKGKIVKAGEDK